MKRKIQILFVFVVLAVVTVFGSACAKAQPPYLLQSGSYSFHKITYTDLLTAKITTKTNGQLFQEHITIAQWRSLFNFSVAVSDSTESVFTSTDRCYILSNGFSYQLIAPDTLQLHFPRLRSTTHLDYEIVIILKRSITL